MAYRADDELPPIEISKVQTLLLPQIERSMASMHHIDELFQWLAPVLVRYFNLPLLLIWANRIDLYGQTVAQLRAMAQQDISFPEQIIVSDQMQNLVQQLISKQTPYNPQPLETLFSHYQVMLLKRYGLYYWCGCFTSKNALLLARKDAMVREGPPAPLTLLPLIFFRSMPPANIMPSLNFVLERTLEAALTRGLLLPLPESQTPFTSPLSPAPTPFPPPPSSVLAPFPSQESLYMAPPNYPTLAQLVPDKKQDADLLLSDNPFTQSVAISDKKARRLYAAINGRDTVSRLCSVTGLSLQEASTALHMLWEQDRVEVRGPDDLPVDLLFFLLDG